MNLEQYCNDNHAVFTPLGARKRTQVKVLEYLQLLAQQTGTPIREWDLTALFKTPDGVYDFELVTEKPEINKRFFAEVERTRGTAVDAGTRMRLDPTLITAIQEGSNRVRNQRIEELKTNIANLRRAAEGAIINTTNHLASARQKQIELDLFENNAADVYAKSLEELLTAGSFEYIGMRDHNRQLHLATTQDFILTYKNDSQEVDLAVNVGRFLIQIELRNARIKVMPHQNNVVVHNYYHPHVTVSGDVCWGNAGPLVTQALSGGNYAEALKLTLGILSSYNDESPYISLAQFHDHVVRTRAAQVVPSVTTVPYRENPWSQSVILNTDGLRGISAQQIVIEENGTFEEHERQARERARREITSGMAIGFRQDLSNGSRYELRYDRPISRRRGYPAFADADGVATPPQEAAGEGQSFMANMAARYEQAMELAQVPGVTAATAMEMLRQIEIDTAATDATPEYRPTALDPDDMPF